MPLGNYDKAEKALGALAGNDENWTPGASSESQLMRAQAYALMAIADQLYLIRQVIEGEDVLT